MKGCRKTYEDILKDGEYRFVLNLKTSNPADKAIIKKLIELSEQGFTNKEALYSMIFEEKIARPEESIRISSKLDSSIINNQVATSTSETEDKNGVNNGLNEIKDIDKTLEKDTNKPSKEETEEEKMVLQKLLTDMYGIK